MPDGATEKRKAVRLTPPQLELLTDIATKPQMYLRRWSRWQKTGQILVRHGLATMESGYWESTEIKITKAGIEEAQRRGIVPTPTAEQASTNG